MIMNRILQINNYPLDRPIHGGQRRSSAVGKYFQSRQVANSAFFSVGIFAEGAYENEYYSSLNFTFQINHPSKHLLGDIFSSFLVAQDVNIISNLSMLIEVEKIDTLLLEQPYLVNVCEALLNKYPHLNFVYNSQNLELPLKTEIYNTLKVPSDLAAEYLAQVEALEINCSKLAKLILVASQNEYDYYNKLHPHVILVPNGIDPKPVLPEFREKIIAKKYSLNEGLFTFLYVASYHPPNITGYENLIGYHLGFLPPFARVLVVGEVSRGLYLSDTYKSQHLYAGKRLEILGRVTDDQLNTIYKNCDAILLPIMSGEGTNLKTAEALSSSKPIIGTPHSFRGFESHISNDENIFMSEDSLSFKKQMIRLVEKSRSGNVIKREPVNDVLWENSFGKLDKWLKEGTDV